jgi:autotransporter-associated beta strand protein
MLDAGTLAFGALDTDLTFAGTIGGTGGLVIDGGATGTRLRTLSGANSFSGGTRLRSGRLTLSGTTPLGTGPLTVENGALFSGLVSTGPALTLSQAVVINDTLRIEGAAPTTLAPTATVSGGGTIEVRGSGGLSIQTASTYTGETRSVFGFAEAAFQAPGNIVLSGVAGSIAASSAVQLAAGSSLTISDATAFTGPAAGRLGDATPLFLRNAKLDLLGNSSAATTEKFGTFNGSGYSTVTISPGAAGGAQLTASALNRVDRGTFLFRAPGLGNAPGAGIGSMIFQQSPPGLIGGGGAGPNVSILPYAVGASSTTGTPLGLVTYDPTGGIRLLNDSTEYTASLTAAAPTHNVRLSGTLANSSEVTLNALVLAGTTTINGAGTIRITSGVLLKAPAISTAGTIANSLDFGAAEANIFVGNAGDSLLLDGAIAGSGGLTKSGDGVLRLSGANSFTGPLTINSGNLQFGSLASLGLDTGPIAINGHSVIIGGNFTTTGLEYIGTKPVTLARDLHLNGGMANLRPGAGLTIGGTISGNGGLWVSGISTGDGYVVLQNANSLCGSHGHRQPARDRVRRVAGPWQLGDASQHAASRWPVDQRALF